MASPRPLFVDLWYPAQVGAREQRHRYLLTSGWVAPEAPIVDQDETLPLVVLSHGSGGSATDYAWLTETLAAHGFVVAGVHHYGESRVYGFSTVDPAAPVRFWERVPDIAAAIRGLRFDPLGARLDFEHQYGVGHSAGGHTLIAAAGVPYDVELLAKYCEEAADDLGCRYARENAASVPEGMETTVQTPVPFSALLLLDPALGPAFTTEALRRFTTTTHIIVSDPPGDFLPPNQHGYRYATALPNSTLLVAEGAGHFAFLGECELNIEVMGVPLCSDSPGVVRRQIHDRAARVALKAFPR